MMGAPRIRRILDAALALGSGVFVSFAPAATLSILEAAPIEQKLDGIRAAVAAGEVWLTTTDGEVIGDAGERPQKPFGDGG